jgi:alginate O-acetyltransferase complex protein AlgI
VSFTSVQYLLFLSIAAALCRFMPRRLQPLWILALSCTFYALGDVRGLIFLGGATAVAYVAALRIESEASPGVRQVWAYGSVIVLVAALLLLKELPMASRPFAWLVPMGISYYSFKLISYVLDVLWERQRAERNLIALAAYGIFFPQIVAGPIQRSTEFLPQVHTPKRLSRDLIRRGAGRIAVGLFKKLVIADQIGIALNTVYASAHDFRGAPLLMAFYLFPIQLYADFSGLTDVAIGSALLLGIESPENFNHPFSATNISEYWRRWHMSLTTWTVDYILTPLRMATRNWGQIGLVFSICMNLMTIALWHGISWTFFAFGVVHCAFVSLDVLSAKRRKVWLRAHPSWDSWATWGGMVLTFHLVAFGMVFWRARSVGDALWILGHLWTAPATLISGTLAFGAAIGWRPLLVGLAAFTLLELAERFAGRAPIFSSLHASPRWIRWSVQAVALVLMLVGVLLLFVHGSVREPFLYEVF